MVNLMIITEISPHSPAVAWAGFPGVGATVGMCGLERYATSCYAIRATVLERYYASFRATVGMCGLEVSRSKKPAKNLDDHGH